MSKKRKRGVIIYWSLLIVYTIALIAAAVYGLGFVWRYAAEYENSQSDNVMDEYIAQLSENLWGEGIADTVAAMEHPVQTNDEVAVHVKDLLSNGISYVRSGVENNGEIIKYSLRCNGNEFGTVLLAEDDSHADELEFGMLPWKVVGEEFDFNGLYSSVEIVVPKTYSVYLNGIQLGGQYIVEENIPYDVLEKYYDDYGQLPTKVRYKYDHVIGTLEFEVRDENGEVYVIDESRDDSQYIKPCTEAELQRLSTFAAGFVTSYLTYTSGAGDPLYTLGFLVPYLLEDGDLFNRMWDALDGLTWAHTASVQVMSSTLNDAINLGDGYYLLDISASTKTFTSGKGEVLNDTNMKVIVVDNGTNVLAISQELY